MSEALYRIIIILAAVGGFSIASYIRHHKRQKRERLVCPIGFHCDPVIHSSYSRFLGMPIEYLGMAYYGLVFLSNLLFLGVPSLHTPIFSFVSLILTSCAFLFSLYLTFVQAFQIKEWCSWCLMSAGLCTIIFAATITGLR